MEERRKDGRLLAILLGVVAFLIVTGGRILDPTHVDWLMEGDPATHWLGWQFFRYSPVFQWPLGANPGYGMEIGSSIVFTDSIPLFAFIFKAINPLLTDTFQYFGLWILTCFCLQTLFAWKLLSRFTPDKWLPLIGSVFFTLAPICLWRLHGHYALFGQWVVLAGLYLYLSRTFGAWRWMALLIVTALIHAYLLAMVLVLYLADLLQRVWLKRIGGLRAAGTSLFSALGLAMVMWAAGYFMVGSGYQIGGAVYRMNFLALIDPGDLWSMNPDGGNDYEGFLYFGLGMLALAGVAVYAYFRHARSRPEKKVVPLLMAMLGLFVYALSDHVAVGAHELFSYRLPAFAEPIALTFRVTSRFFWPVYYALYLAIFYVLFTRVKRKTAISLCLAMLIVHAADSVDYWRMFIEKFSQQRPWVSPLRSAAWRELASQYRKVIYVLPRNNSAGWLPLAQFAGTHRMAINTGYFARVDPKIETAARMRLANAMVNNEFSADSLYVFDDGPLWKFASSALGAADSALILDGFRLLAPNLGACRECRASSAARITAGRSDDFDYRRRISFTSTGDAQNYQLYGWTAAEDWGTWSEGDTALLAVTLANAPQGDVELVISGHALLSASHSSQAIDVLVNEQPVGVLRYEPGSNEGSVRMVKIPWALMAHKNGRLLIRFNIRNPKSPAEQGLSGDIRRLGLGIVSVELREGAGE